MKHFTLAELTRSDTAKQRRIPNVPDDEQTQNLTALVDNLLDPVREAFGQPIIVTSGYRSPRLNAYVGGAKNSQHTTGQAADIRAKYRKDNRLLFQIIRDTADFDQLIWEKGDHITPQWIHVSYRNDGKNRHQVLYIK